MTIRVFASAPVSTPFGNGTIYDAYAAKYCTGKVNFFPSKADGTPAATWVITIGKNTDWSAAEADPAVTDIFAGDLPGSVVDRDSLISFLKTRTISNVPLAKRNIITSNLDTLGVNRADFVGATKLWKVFQRIISSLSEKDDNYGSGFNL